MLRRALKHGLVDMTKWLAGHTRTSTNQQKKSSRDMARAHRALAEGTFAVDSCWEKVAIFLSRCVHC